jgi:hypothetical protein
MHAHRHSNARTHALGTHARAIARTRADARARKRCNVAWCTFLCRISGCRLHRSMRCNGCIVARRTNAARWLTSAARTATTTGTCRSCCARSEIGTSATRPATAGSSRCGAAACAARREAVPHGTGNAAAVRSPRDHSCDMLGHACAHPQSPPLLPPGIWHAARHVLWRMLHAARHVLWRMWHREGGPATSRLYTSAARSNSTRSAARRPPP